jgi:hypothetical protein
MVPPDGASKAERWVAEGRKVAAIDLIQLLQSLKCIDEIHLLVGDQSDRDLFSGMEPESITTSEVEFVFAKALLNFAIEELPNTLVYFGAGSAPLLSRDALEQSVVEVMRSNSPRAVVNNLHSTDWAVFNRPSRIAKFVNRLPSDNQLGWVMKNEIGYQVESLAPSAATRMDIDTPTDLIILSHHHKLGSATKQFLKTNTLEANVRLSRLRELLKQSAMTLTVIGRSSADVLQQLDRQTQIWIRAFVEERGMVASGRLARGEVRSLLGEYMDQVGFEAAIEFLTSISDGVLWDTRVWMGHERKWPSVADRFASDLGWVEEIEENRVRMFTELVVGAQIPITTGGHGTVAGGVLALLESLQRE